MQLYSLLIVLQFAVAALAARSGSQVDSYALSGCTSDLATIKDIANDGVQGAPCQTYKVLHRTDGTLYRNLAQSVKTTNIQAGCTARAYSAPNCAKGTQILEVVGPVTGEQCNKLNGYAESVEITCN